MLQTKTKIAGCLIIAGEFLEEFPRSIQQPAARSNEESLGATMKIDTKKLTSFVGRLTFAAVIFVLALSRVTAGIWIQNNLGLANDKPVPAAYVT
ncbi:MAG: hypothetical protein ABI646_04240 [Acidobacteriota bacterium]